MIYVHRSLIVPAAHAPMASALCAVLGTPGGDGMFTTGMSPDGATPATHYISSGMVLADMASLLASEPATIHAACQQVGLPYTLAQIAALMAAADVSEDDWQTAAARVGVQLIVEAE